MKELHFRVHTPDMNDNDSSRNLLYPIPEGSLLHEIQQVEFVAAVRQGLKELDRGEQIPIEEVERELASWAIK